MKLVLSFCVLALLVGSVLPCTASLSLVDHYLKALDADSQNPTLRYHLGVALLDQGENKPALMAFKAAYPQRADDPEINVNLALVSMRLNDPDSALIYLDQALASGAGAEPEIYPLQNLYFNLVLSYAQSGQLEAAVALLERLISSRCPRIAKFGSMHMSPCLILALRPTQGQDISGARYEFHGHYSSAR